MIHVNLKFAQGVLALAKHHDVELILHTEECTSLLQDIAPYAA